MKKFFLLTLIFTFSAASAIFAQEPVKYKDGETNLEGYLAKAKNKRAPGVVIIHQWMGLTQHEKTAADKLAALGYHALAADIYGVGNRPKDQAEAGKLAGKYKTDYKLFQSRIKAAIDKLVALGADADQIVVIGYCFGGTGALEAARANLKVKGVVSFHGGLKKDASRPNEAIKAKVLVLHGADDPFVPKEEVDQFQQEMKTIKADWEMTFYANAVHAFTQTEAGNDNSKGAAYNAEADRKSWARLEAFLAEVLK